MEDEQCEDNQPKLIPLEATCELTDPRLTKELRAETDDEVSPTYLILPKMQMPAYAKINIDKTIQAESSGLNSCAECLCYKCAKVCHFLFNYIDLLNKIEQIYICEELNGCE